MTEQDEHKLIAQRRQKLAQLREQGAAYPNDFRRDAVAAEIHTEYGDKDRDWFEANVIRVKVAGRMMGKRVMGKASFVPVQDLSLIHI